MMLVEFRDRFENHSNDTGEVFSQMSDRAWELVERKILPLYDDGTLVGQGTVVTDKTTGGVGVLLRQRIKDTPSNEAMDQLRSETGLQLEHLVIWAGFQREEEIVCFIPVALIDQASKYISAMQSKFPLPAAAPTFGM